MTKPGRAAVAAALLLLACGGKDSTGPTPDDNGLLPPAGMASCPSSAFLTQVPVPVASIRSIGPLGTMTGGGHVLPAPHLGVQQVPGIAAPAPVSAPGAITIRQVRRTIYGTGPSAPEDYALFYFPCADVRMHFGHLTTLDDGIVTQMGGWGATDCAAPYTVGTLTVTQCTKNVMVAVTAGTALGTQLGPLDWGAGDRRARLAYANTTRMGGDDDPYGLNFVACPVDYLTAAPRASLHDLFGEADVFRTTEPVCGIVMQDVPGTAQGRWFVDSSVDERLHMALVHDYVDPSVGALSVGSSIPSVPADLYRFTPVDTGRVNLDFSLVVPDGLIYCYESTTRTGAADAILIRMMSATTLRIEGMSGTACGDPATWAFTASAVDFAR